MSSTTITNVDAVRGGFEAFGRGDLDGFIAMFQPDATWNHRNDDRLGGVHQGRAGILSFIEESGRLTAGTLRAAPEGILAGADGRVAVVTRITGTRPDGRSFDDQQILLFEVADGLVRRVDQYIGDPTAVTAFWA